MAFSRQSVILRRLSVRPDKKTQLEIAHQIVQQIVQQIATPYRNTILHASMCKR
jgi:hypothetical protein